jgi:hypothetical protein
VADQAAQAVRDRRALTLTLIVCPACCPEPTVV